MSILDPVHRSKHIIEISTLFRCLFVNENLVGFFDQINGKESGILDVIVHLFLFCLGGFS